MALVILGCGVGCTPSTSGGPSPGTGGDAAAGEGGTGLGGSSAGGASAGGAGRGGSGGSAAAGTGGGPAGSAGTTGSAGASVAGTGGGGSTGGSAAGAGGSASAGTNGGGNGGRGGASGTTGNGGTTGTAGNGAAGSGSGGAAGAVASACNAGPPSPPAGGANFPFPQHRASSVCTYPTTCSDSDAAMGWAAYKTALVVADGSGDGSLRVQRDAGNGNDTVSESVSYGMLFAVYLNDKTTFDDLWKYEQKHLDTHGLMNWHINSNGTTASGGLNSATDADEDMAFALLLADKQWGGYTTVATNMISTVAMNDFGTDGTVKGGDTYVAVDPSYLAPAFYRAFGLYTGDTRWTTILNKTYSILSMVADATTGLVPDWSSGRTGAGNYTYDATRTPFRIALDACWNNDPNAMAFSKKIGGFFAGLGAAAIKDGYNLNGTVIGANHNSTFVGPAGAAGMAANQAKLVADAYAFVAPDARGTTTNYYDRSWALFTTLLMTGNFIDLSAL
jgi:endo-1,4-beta-D-glucanase Y